MRRLASVLAASSRRSDKSDVPSSSSSSSSAADDTARPRLVHKKSRIFPSLPRKHHPSPDSTSIPPLVASDLANSSSSSLSGSTTLRTPDDDGLSHTPIKKGSWKSWLGRKNATPSDHPEGHYSRPWQSSQNVLPLPNSGSSVTDDTSSHSDDPYGNPDDIHAPSYSPQQMVAAHANARTMVMNSLVLDITSPPLFHSSDTISFPRSSHSSRHLRRRETLESELHRKSLLARLDRPSFSADSSIAPLALKSISLKSKTHSNFQDDVFPLVDSVSFRSSGLENWLSRPCFEDRIQLWTRSDSGETICTRIPGSILGVAALEFSESLELLAGTFSFQDNDEDVSVNMEFDPTLEFTLSPLTFNPDSPATPIKDSKVQPLSPSFGLLQSGGSPAARFPSPQLSSAQPALSQAPSPAQQLDGTSGLAPTIDPVPKRGVRFADDDGKDDQIPLGYVLRIRRNKEQKARFLREERERRERAAQHSMVNRRVTAPPQDASRATISRQLPTRSLISLNEPSQTRQPATVSHVFREEERLRREAERIEIEKLRRSRDLAKRQAEERERAYTEEVRATRARREASRAGRPLESGSLSSRVSDRNHSASRDSLPASLRRSSMSHKYTPELVFSPVSPTEGSPSSSLPATPGSQYSFSRPPSIYSAHTTSSEDVRGRDNKLGGRRMSVVSDSAAKGMLLHPPYDPRVSFNPYGWTNVSPVPVIPPVPPMPAIPTVNGVPFHGMEMPLLPPAAPFMMNQFGVRPRSYTGSSGQHSPVQSTTSLSRNYSSEGVNSSSRNSSPHSFRSHQRRSSDDATRMAKTLGDSRSGSYNDVRGGKMSGSLRVTPSQGGLPRSSWLPPEQSPTKKSSLRPVSGGYSSGAHAQARRQTTAS